jgi:putative PIN family toxin of toxin-antitoxin system
MRVVIDTNVVISAILKENSVPALAVDLVAREHTLLSSIDTQSEIHRVLARPRFRRYLTAQAMNLINTIFAESEFTVITQSVTACRDPMDNKFLELALDGKADFIISGDEDLLCLTNYLGVPIITPAEFLTLWQIA